MRKWQLISLFCLTVHPAMAAEAWNCRVAGYSGVWQIDGDDLVLPGARRLEIIRDSATTLIATSGDASGDFEIAVLDRRRLTVKTIVLDVLADTERRETGSCVLPSARVAAEARAAVTTVRPRIRDLVGQAKSLADRGFTTAAGLKWRKRRNSAA
jgi:hypothetical protein